MEVLCQAVASANLRCSGEKFVASRSKEIQQQSSFDCIGLLCGRRAQQKVASRPSDKPRFLTLESSEQTRQRFVPSADLYRSQSGYTWAPLAGLAARDIVFTPKLA